MTSARWAALFLGQSGRPSVIGMLPMSFKLVEENVWIWPQSEITDTGHAIKGLHSPNF